MNATGRRYIIGRAPSSCTPQEYMAQVRSLYQAPDVAPESKAAKGLKLHVQGSGAIIICCTRETKEVLESELAALATEYSQDPAQLRALFEKRKFTIKNEHGEVLNAKRTRKPTRRKKAQEGDAHIIPIGQSDGSENKLFQSGPSADMPQEGALSPESES